MYVYRLRFFHVNLGRNYKIKAGHQNELFFPYFYTWCTFISYVFPLIFILDARLSVTFFPHFYTWCTFIGYVFPSFLYLMHVYRLRFFHVNLGRNYKIKAGHQNELFFLIFLYWIHVYWLRYFKNLSPKRTVFPIFYIS